MYEYASKVHTKGYKCDAVVTTSAKINRGIRGYITPFQLETRFWRQRHTTWE